MKEPDGSYPNFCHNLKKVYIRQDGNYRRHAVQSLSLAVLQGECFGMLGPSGSADRRLPSWNMSHGGYP
uniref:Uncharacterized protein n=1 Tax=Nelumbo nucifera TaxID=4432 RepID=A0A822XRL9_NELNU|nr:TPA_asm: hypothetical protein HUJ06_023254 [Nelumbo nucifera]